jgi:hypothetical protein
MIRADITIRVNCDTKAEAEAAKKKLEEVKATILDWGINPTTFTATMKQELAEA